MTVPAPGAHGGDAPSIAAALGLNPAEVLDLSASLNPFAPDVAKLAIRHLDALIPYPDDSRATAAMAEALNENPARVVLTNGGAEAIALVAAHVGKGHVIQPEFSLYERHLPQLDSNAGRWRSNPSNPIGRLAEADETAAVWDEAFYPLATGRWTRGDSDAWRLGSLTKIWACAGLRLGFAIAPDTDSADAVRAARPRWAVNGLALALLPDLLEASDLSLWRDQIANTRDQFVAGLEKLGLDVSPSVANWVLVAGVAGLRDALALSGIVVRDCSSFGLAGTVRIAVPFPDDLGRVLAAIERWKACTAANLDRPI